MHTFKRFLRSKQSVTYIDKLANCIETVLIDHFELFLRKLGCNWLYSNITDTNKQIVIAGKALAGNVFTCICMDSFNPLKTNLVINKTNHISGEQCKIILHGCRNLVIL